MIPGTWSQERLRISLWEGLVGTRQQGELASFLSHLTDSYKLSMVSFYHGIFDALHDLLIVSWGDDSEWWLLFLKSVVSKAVQWPQKILLVFGRGSYWWNVLESMAVVFLMFLELLCYTGPSLCTLLIMGPLVLEKCISQSSPAKQKWQAHSFFVSLSLFLCTYPPIYPSVYLDLL